MKKNVFCALVLLAALGAILFVTVFNGLSVGTDDGGRAPLSMGLKLLISAGILLVALFVAVGPYLYFPLSLKDWWGKGLKPENPPSLKEWAVLCCILLFYSVISITAMAGKQGLGLDEAQNFALANAYTRYPILTYYTEQSTADFFTQWMSVNDQNPGFEYSHVWENQHADTHPPLYYVLVHTICSFQPGIYSKWQSFGINYLFGILSLGLLFLMCKMLFRGSLAPLAAVLILAVSPGFMSVTLFLRMYVMVVFFSIALAVVALLWASGKWSMGRFLVWYAIVLCLGTLTQYYFLIYAFFISLLLFLLFLYRRQFREAAQFALMHITSAALTVAVFPGIIYHLLRGGRGKESISNFVDIMSFPQLFLQYSERMFQCFGGVVFLPIFIAAVAGIIWMIFKKEPNGVLFAGMAFVSVAYFLIIVKIAPYRHPRYISLIFPLISAFVTGGICFILREIFTEGKIKLRNAAALAVTFVWTALCLYQNYSVVIPAAQASSFIKTEKPVSTTCVFVNNFSGDVWERYDEIMGHEKVIFVPGKNMEGPDFTGDEFGPDVDWLN